ncbi:MAG: Fur family transcriptional regulator [Microbacteriaceae bacterium]|jgi:Fe2+ or Zn2+ uptake regulation protein|nr:Fur family transcriptional regulator [Microbacteriaceae bacterium]
MHNGRGDQLRGAGLRVTSGRMALLAAIERQPHSDAESLRQLVLADLPSISVQSVHNVLADLTMAGLIRRIEPAGSAALYERRVGDNHHHVVCSSCAAVADVDCVHGAAPCLAPSNTNGYLVSAAEVTFWGLCPNCRPAIDERDEMKEIS